MIQTVVLNVLGLVALAALLVLPFRFFRAVPQGQVWIVLLFGKYTRTLRPGFNLLFWPLEKVGEKVDVQEQMVDVPTQDVITKDNAAVKVDGVAFYVIVNPAASVYAVKNLRDAIRMLKTTNLRAVIGSMELDQVLSHRDEINRRLMAVIGEATRHWGVEITRVEIRELSPPERMQKVMEQQMTAERERRAAVSLAEGSKQAAILQAEGEREAAFMRAEGREREAEAEAHATKMVSAALRDGDTAAINYFVANKYLDALGKFANSPNEKLLILPTEITGVIGSLAGIAEIAQRTFSPKSTVTKLQAAE